MSDPTYGTQDSAPGSGWDLMDTVCTTQCTSDLTYGTLGSTIGSGWGLMDTVCTVSDLTKQSSHTLTHDHTPGYTLAA